MWGAIARTIIGRRHQAPATHAREAARAWHAVGPRKDSFYRDRRLRHHRTQIPVSALHERGFGQSRRDSHFQPIAQRRLRLPRSLDQLRSLLKARASSHRQLAKPAFAAWRCQQRQYRLQPTHTLRRQLLPICTGAGVALSLQLSKLRQVLPLTSIQRSKPSMAPAQTQSLPAWASIPALPSVTKPGASAAFDDEDPLYLSGEETDCDSERGSDTLSREDQQLMASFIRLQKEKRAHKQVYHQATRPAVSRTTPMLIPTQTRKYVATSTKRWLWDEDDEEDDCDQCPCCNHQSVERRSATSPVVAEATDASAISDLMFDLEL
ncbi:hypothetical protein F444_06295 [Phytophthora nicotianae P1976]|nr:hypothetical protein F444_06295 [Phytophthora nicotianae P1976]